MHKPRNIGKLRGMYKFITSFFILYSLISVVYGQIFIPERGLYIYSLVDIERTFDENEMNYVSLNPGQIPLNSFYKLNKDRFEFQIKDWFLRDWFILQDQFVFNLDLYISKFHAPTFLDAKRVEYKKFPFLNKKFYHLKSTPSLKEWGGLTHPPLKELDKSLDFYHSKFTTDAKILNDQRYFNPDLHLLIDRKSRSELTFQNKVDALEDKNSWLLKKKLIHEAKESILISSLVFVCDPSTKEIVNLLIKKHYEGLDVRVIVDRFISKLLGHRECLKQMRAEGIQVLEFKEFFKHNFKAIYHTKTLVTDFKQAIAGGTNLIDADNTSLGVNFKNRDVDLYIQGPMVADVAEQFIDNWNFHLSIHGNQSGFLQSLNKEKEKITNLKNLQRDLKLRGSAHYLETLSHKEKRMKGVCRFVAQMPHLDVHTIGKAYLQLLDQVQNHLIITDPIKSDSFTEDKRDLALIDKWDSFEMYNLLHTKVLDLAKKGKRVDYITTSIDMAGNENVAIMNERIQDQLSRGKKVRALWSYLKLIASNKYFGKPHFKNLLKDWAFVPNVYVWNHIAFMHSKIFYFDRIVASVGSYNFQHNATDQAYESTAICMDKNLNSQLDRILVQDMVNSIPLIFSHLE